MQQQERIAPPAFGHDLVKNAPRGRIPRVFFLLVAALFGSLITMGIQAVARYAPLDATSVRGAVEMDGKPLRLPDTGTSTLGFDGPSIVRVRALPGHTYDEIIQLSNNGHFGVTVRGFPFLPDGYRIWLNDGCCIPSKGRPFHPFALQAGDERTLTLEITIPACPAGTRVTQALWPLDGGATSGIGSSLRVRFSLMGISRVQRVPMGTDLVLVQAPISPVCAS